MTFTAVKNRARMCMENNRRSFFGETALIIVLLLSSGAAMWLIGKACDSYGLPQNLQLTAELAATVLIALFIAAVRQGQEAWRFRLLCRGDASAWQIAFWISGKRCIKAFALFLSVLFRKVLWLLLAVPGGLMLLAAWRMQQGDSLFMIFLAGGTVCFLTGVFFWLCIIQRYAMCRFLLALKPEMPRREAIRYSVRLMDGKCVKLLRFKASFLPWWISCVFLFSVFYVTAFYQQSLSVFKYQIVKNYTVP